LKFVDIIVAFIAMQDAVQFGVPGDYDAAFAELAIALALVVHF
jgi:hypothetical protein